MKVFLPVDSKQNLGGGFTFQRNLTKGLRSIGVDVVESMEQAEIALISGVTMITKETYQALKDRGLKVIVRLDNVPRNSRNRGTGTPRLKNYSERADEVVWQGEWSKYYLKDFIGKEGVIIHNGVDLDIYKPEGRTIKEWQGEGKVNYLYSRFNRDETKNWEVAWYEFQMLNRERIKNFPFSPKPVLHIVGKFAPENVEYNFDFFRGESIDFLGVVDNPESMAKVMRSCQYMLATYFNDAFSNTYLEFLCTKNPKVAEAVFIALSYTGGTPEMIKLWNNKGREYFSLERMAKDYKWLFEKVLNR